MDISLDSLAIYLDSSCFFSFWLAFELHKFFIEAINILEFVRKAGLFLFKIDFPQNRDIILSHLFFLFSNLVFSFLYFYLSAHSFLQVLKDLQEVTDGSIQFVHLIEDLVIDSADLKELLLGLLGKFLQQLLVKKSDPFVFFVQWFLNLVPWLFVEAIDHFW